MIKTILLIYRKTTRTSLKNRCNLPRRENKWFERFDQVPKNSILTFIINLLNVLILNTKQIALYNPHFNTSLIIRSFLRGSKQLNGVGSPKIWALKKKIYGPVLLPHQKINSLFTFFHVRVPYFLSSHFSDRKVDKGIHLNLYFYIIY